MTLPARRAAFTAVVSVGCMGELCARRSTIEPAGGA
jgi:hypothetical protein